MNPRPQPDRDAEPEPGPLPVRVTGNLDLHTFRPRDLPELLPAWFEECRALGIPAVRVIHGKGTGTLRAGVHALLAKMAEGPDPLVKSWTFPAPESAGGWGATVVQLRGTP
ncbi:MAG: Smr/MutS family protein [Verrucomicrobiota bacterium]